MKPVIAMPQMGESLFRKYMKSKYVQSLARAGAEVCWIELEDPVKASAQAARCAGLLSRDLTLRCDPRGRHAS